MKRLPILLTLLVLGVSCGGGDDVPDSAATGSSTTTTTTTTVTTTTTPAAATTTSASTSALTARRTVTTTTIGAEPTTTTIGAEPTTTTATRSVTPTPATQPPPTTATTTTAPPTTTTTAAGTWTQVDYSQPGRDPSPGYDTKPGKQYRVYGSCGTGGPSYYGCTVKLYRGDGYLMWSKGLKQGEKAAEPIDLPPAHYYLDTGGGNPPSAFAALEELR